MLFVVFAIVALGILNTLLMSLFERVREFGVLMAIGARPHWVLRLVLMESALLGLLGTALGRRLGARIRSPISAAPDCICPSATPSRTSCRSRR